MSAITWFIVTEVDDIDFMQRAASRMLFIIESSFCTLLTHFEPLYTNMYLIGPSDGAMHLGLEVMGQPLYPMGSLKCGPKNFARQVGVGLLIYCSWQVSLHFFAKYHYCQNVQFLNVNVFIHWTIRDSSISYRNTNICTCYIDLCS